VRLGGCPKAQVVRRIRGLRSQMIWRFKGGASIRQQTFVFSGEHGAVIAAQRNSGLL
jgi:hypothetical protein